MWAQNAFFLLLFCPSFFSPTVNLREIAEGIQMAVFLIFFWALALSTCWNLLCGNIHRPQKSFFSLFLIFSSYRHNNTSIQLANFFNTQLCLETFFFLGGGGPARLSLRLSYIKSDGLSLGLSPNHSTIFPSCAWLEF